MPKRYRSLIMASLQPVREGASFEKLPLHITVVPDFFPVSTETEALQDELKQEVNKLGQFRTIGLEEDHFGPRHNVRVRKLGGSLLYHVHDKLLPIALKYDPHMNLKHSGMKNYDPHVTFIDNKGMDLGQRVEITMLTLAQKQPEENWQILDNFQLEPRRVDINWR